MGDICQAATASLLQIDKNNTLPDWFNLHRQLCTDWVRDNPKIIGGPGRTVQIDESLVSSNKRTRNGRARPFRQRWVFGGIDNVSKEAFLEEARQNCLTSGPLMRGSRFQVGTGTSVPRNRFKNTNGTVPVPRVGFRYLGTGIA
ncbi:hypothetical protein HELRODRAFT_166780 [Helobdella robusta]|uniref:ISXO2-like transposase domain-containing protein n=1 Tax=Helobdella robusta TaxID=6412 RepID=T1EYI7_HELRO|nr:hypothetical protein HELRODRAFT_166780 [Helobdella robusta]ESO11753.1 hypothetical protein HELRODRAFT_166780 [Helobdella robusta]